MRALAVLTIFAMTTLTGCASNPSVASLTSEQRQKVAELVEFPSGSLARESYQIVGSAKGLACKRNLYASGKPSLEEAQQGVRIRAALMGAEAVTNVLCEDKQEVDWGNNCWQTVVCVGDAITVNDKSLLRRPASGPASQ
jgi:ABC-type phosphate transport system substrate-binding protein